MHFQQHGIFTQSLLYKLENGSRSPATHWLFKICSQKTAIAQISPN